MAIHMIHIAMNRRNEWMCSNRALSIHTFYVKYMYFTTSKIIITSVKLGTVADGQICSIAVGIENNGENGRLHSKFALPYCKFVVNRK